MKKKVLLWLAGLLLTGTTTQAEISFHWENLYQVTLEDGTVLNCDKTRYYGEDCMRIREIATDATALEIPSSMTVTIDNEEVEYPVQIIGYSDESDWWKALAPNLSVLTLPASIKEINVKINETTALDELHMLGSRPSRYYNDSWNNSGCAVYIHNQEYLKNYKENWSNVYKGWTPRTKTFDVETPGDFSYIYQVDTDANWGAYDQLIVKGELNDVDLSAFYNMTMLDKLDLSGATFTVVPQNFLYNSRLMIEHVILPESVTSLSDYAFYSCEYLESINAQNVIDLGYQCFAYTNRLKTVDISSVKTTDSSIFNYSYGLEYIEIPSSLVAIPSDFLYRCENLKEVKINNGVKSIGSCAFAYNRSLSSINLPEGLQEIQNSAFAYSGLEAVSIPSSVVKISDYAFQKCDSLQTVKTFALIPPTATTTIFEGLDARKTTLYAPNCSQEAYRHANGWSIFYKVEDLTDPISNINVVKDFDLTITEADNAIFANNPTINLIQDNNYNTVGQLTINGDGTLSADKVTYMSRLYPVREYSDSRYKYDLRASFINNNVNATGKSVDTEIYFSEPCNRWQFISFPYDVNVADINIVNKDSVTIYCAIREYDGEARAAADGTATWKNVSANGVLKANKGYIINMNKPDDYYYSPTIHFPSASTPSGFFASEDVTIPLTQYSAETPNNASWNLIGNPYPAYMPFEGIDGFYAPITIWRGQTYQAYSPIDDDVIIRPNEAFFIQAPEGVEGISFKADARIHYQEAMDLNNGCDVGTKMVSANDVARNVFNIKLAGNEYYDRARVVINEDADMAYEIGRDASKFLNAGSAPQLYSVAGGINYDINERPLDDGIVALTASFPAEGIYTFSLNGRFSEDFEVILVDNYTGKTIDLRNEEYSFDAQKGTQNDRFYLMITNVGLSGIDTIESEVEANAIVTVTAINGQVVYQGARSGMRVANTGIYVVSTEVGNYKARLNK